MSRKALWPVILLGLLYPSAARAGDVTVFVSWARPSDNWARGYGATLSSTWFRVISLEGEAARQPAALGDTTTTSFTGSALLSPSIGFFTPYGGVGVGIFRQSGSNSASDTGTLKAWMFGGKLRFGLLVLKAEYRKMDLSGQPLLILDHRLSAGAGISF